MGKSYNYEIIYIIITLCVKKQLGSGGLLDSDPDGDFLAGSGFNEYGSKTLTTAQYKKARICREDPFFKRLRFLGYD